ncbi:MAG: hypothetical protein RL219_778 [Actinomycetota bacterium]|jgi:predicted nucleic acid-binding Zn ribbon protein
MSASGRRHHEPVPLTKALDEVFRSLQPPGAPSVSAKVVGGVFNRWDDAVGPQVSAHARPVRLHEGTLVVEVDEPGWATQLRYLEREILERLAAVGGSGVERIEVRVRRR